jgi:hypothetical protein
MACCYDVDRKAGLYHSAILTGFERTLLNFALVIMRERCGSVGGLLNGYGQRSCVNITSKKPSGFCSVCNDYISVLSALDVPSFCHGMLW